MTSRLILGAGVIAVALLKMLQTKASAVKIEGDVDGKTSDENP